MGRPEQPGRPLRAAEVHRQRGASQALTRRGPQREVPQPCGVRSLGHHRCRRGSPSGGAVSLRSSVGTGDGPHPTCPPPALGPPSSAPITSSAGRRHSSPPPATSRREQSRGNTAEMGGPRAGNTAARSLQKGPIKWHRSTQSISSLSAPRVPLRCPHAQMPEQKGQLTLEFT